MTLLYWIYITQQKINASKFRSYFMYKLWLPLKICRCFVIYNNKRVTGEQSSNKFHLPQIIHGLWPFMIYLKIMSSSRIWLHWTLNKHLANTSYLFNDRKSHILEADIYLWNSFRSPLRWLFSPNNLLYHITI